MLESSFSSTVLTSFEFTSASIVPSGLAGWWQTLRPSLVTIPGGSWDMSSRYWPCIQAQLGEKESPACHEPSPVPRVQLSTATVCNSSAQFLLQASEILVSTLLLRAQTLNLWGISNLLIHCLICLHFVGVEQFPSAQSHWIGTCTLQAVTNLHTCWDKVLSFLPALCSLADCTWDCAVLREMLGADIKTSITWVRISDAFASQIQRETWETDFGVSGSDLGPHFSLFITASLVSIELGNGSCRIFWHLNSCWGALDCLRHGKGDQVGRWGIFPC